MSGITKQNPSNAERKIYIKGPAVLRGKVKIGGSKNAALPILAATLITDKKCTIRNVPDLLDISVMMSLLEVLGKKVCRRNSYVVVEETGALSGEAPYHLVKQLRASVLVMGALTGRKNSIYVALPGGCAIGSRPIDLHLKGFRRLGAKISLSGGFVNLSSKGLKGANISLDYPSVGATENLIMAACRVKGETVIENIAVEPEVIELIKMLQVMGADIDYFGNKVLISGKKDFNSVDFRVMDDRIQAGTYLIAGCIKNSAIEIDFSHPEVLESLIEKLSDCGARITVSNKKIITKRTSKLSAVEIRTAPYPGFPTDLQAPFTSLMTVAKGVSVITEEIFENRFLHSAELKRMGADVEIKGKSAIVSGSGRLSGVPVNAYDLRGGAAMIIAGLIAKGTTEISDIWHIERGYENIVENLKKLGADIWIE